MTRRIAFATIVLLLLQGCATQLSVRSASTPDDRATGFAGRELQFRNLSITPDGDAALLPAASLQPGDIILTSGPGLVSASIQLFTLAPVSHAAIYVGNGIVVEAVRPEVQVRHLDELLAEGSVAVVLRYPGLSSGQALAITDYALRKAGTGFNFLGVTLHMPFSVTRKVCELPLVPPAVRDACIRSFGMMNYLAASESRLFCSQLVLEAYRQAGVPITDADPRLISPADILHMREGDVPSVRIRQSLRYIGHLKYQRDAVATVAF